jgi:UDPglucose 6-dehydrogenase
VVGSEDQSAAAKVLSLYLGISAPTVVTDPASAETIKYAANAFLATKLSFVNAIAAVCEGVGADVNDVILGLGYDTRIGSEFLRPGPGWGGSCFPKDTKALVCIAEQGGYDFRLLDGVIAVNVEQFARVVDKVRRSVGGDLSGRTIAVWGLTFKAGTDDLRGSPAVEVISRLLEQGALVHAFDPTVSSAEGLPSGTTVALTPMDACVGADSLVVLTEWDEFRRQDPETLAVSMKNQVVVDARNLLDRARWQRHGFQYQGIGR